MKINQLQKIIQKNIASHTLALPITQLVSTKTITVFNRYLPNQILTIRQATISATQEQVEVTGVLSLLGLTDCPATAVFYLFEQKVQLCLTIELPQAWLFRHSFPNMEADTLLDKHQFTDSQLIINSYSTVDNTTPLRNNDSETFDNSLAGESLSLEKYKSELEFSGKLNIATLLPDMRGLIDDSIPLKFTGHIEKDDKNKPEIHLAAQMLPPIKVDHFSLAMQLRITYENVFGLYPYAYYTLLATLKFNDDQLNIELPLFASFGGNTNNLYFSANLSDLNFNNLAQLSGLLNGAPTTSLLPANCQFSDELLALSTFMIEVDTKNKTLGHIAIGLTSSALWEITDTLTVGLSSFDLGLDSPMDVQQRSLSCDASGTLLIDKAVFNVDASFPDCTFTGEMASENTLNLTVLLTKIIDSSQGLPAGFPHINLTELYISFAVTQKHFGFSGRTEDDWPVIPNLLRVTQVSTDVRIDWSGKKTRFNGMISGSLRLAGVDIDLTAEVNDKLTLQGSIPQLPLSKLLQELIGTQLPPELPEVQLDNLKIEITPAKSNFLLQGAATIQWQLGDQQLVCDIAVSFSRKDENITCAITAAAKGPVTIADELTFENIGLIFSCDTASKSWSVSGNIVASCFDHQLALTAAYTKTDKHQQLELATSHSAVRPLIDIESVASLNYKKLTIALEKQTGNGYAWQLTATAGVIINDLADLQGHLEGHLELYRKADNARGLIFKPSKTDVKVPLIPKQGILKQPIDVILALDGLTFTKQHNQWTFDSGSRLSLHGIPREINRFFNPSHPDQPFTLKTELTANEQGVAVTLSSPLHFEVPFPDLALNDITLSLGTGAVGISSVMLKIGRDIAFDIQIGIALPERINHMFGLDDKKQPNFSLFKDYTTGQYQQSAFDVGITISTAGLSANIYTSPLQDHIMQIKREGNASYCHLDFQAFGAIRFMLPSFSLDLQNGSLRARGGFDVTKPLSLPLTPAKTLLKQLNVKELGDIFPDTLPLQGISIYDTDKKQFKEAELIRLLESPPDPLPKNLLPQAIKAAITEIGKYANLLPDALKPYLNIEIPQSFFFDVRITPDASLKCDLSVYDPDIPRNKQPQRQPIKALIPGIVTGAPTRLTGIQFYSFSLGELWSGSLLLAEVDMIVDQFDIVEMATSLALTATNSNKQLASSRDLKQRFIIEKLFMPIIYQTGIPIPVPLFYKQLGFEATTLVGGTLQTHIGLPMPTLNIMELIKGLTNLKKFLTDPDFLLNPADKPKKLDLKLQLPNNYLQLPEFMGSEILGIKGELEFSAYEMIAQALNFCKKLSINQLIQLIPLKDRVGKFDGQKLFDPLELATVQWLVTTPEEFTQIGFKQLQIPQNATGSFLNTLPKIKGNTHEEGIIVFLKGDWAMQELASFEVVFALATSGSQGFHTGLKIAGNIKNTIDMEMSGQISINLPKPEEQSPQHTYPVSPTGAKNYALLFNGTQTPTRSTKSVSLANCSFTIEFWAKRNNTNQYNFIIGHGLGQQQVHQDLHIGFVGNNDNRFLFSFYGDDLFVDVSYTDQEWHHWACVYDNTSKKRWVYRDGVKVASDTAAGHYQGIGSLVIGETTFALPFNGFIDEVRVWNVARNSAEIEDNTHLQLTGQESKLVGYWSFAEGSGKTIHDKSVSANHLSLQNTALWSDSPLQLTVKQPQVTPHALTLNAQTARITTNNPVSLANASFTIEFWAKRNSVNQYNFVIGHGQGKQQTGQDLHIGFVGDNDNRFLFSFFHDNLFVDANYTDQKWHHWACVYDHTSLNRTIYRDGIQVAQNTSSGHYQGVGRLIIGQTSFGLPFEGQIDDVRVWNIARSNVEIQTDMNQKLTGYEAGLHGYWSFDEGFGTIAHDQTVSTNHLTLQGAEWSESTLDLLPKQTQASISQFQAAPHALVFNGLETPVNCGSRIQLANKSFAIEFWAKRDNATGYNFIIGHGQGNQQTRQDLHIGFVGDDDNRFLFSFFGDNLFADVKYSDQKWHHWTCVYDAGSKKRCIYRDGIEIATDTAAEHYQGTGDFIIGQTSFKLPFNGQVDDVRVWGSVRSQADIQATMRQQLNGKEPNLIAYWSLDEGTGLKANDKTPNGHHGILSATKWIPSTLKLDAPIRPLSVSSPTTSGIILLDQEDIIQLNGHSHLTILRHKAFVGDLSIADDRFQLSGQLDLFPASMPLSAKGAVKGWLNDGEFYLAGRVEVALLEIPLVGASVLITNDQVFLEGKLLGSSTKLLLERKSDKYTAQGAVILNVFGLYADAFVMIDTSGHAEFKGSIDPIDLHVLKITGAGQSPKPSFDLEIANGFPSKVAIFGAIELLGLRSETAIQVSNRSFSFTSTGKIFNLFSATLSVSGNNLGSQDNIQVTAVLQNDFFSYAVKNALAVIKQEVNKASSGLTAAQEDINKAQAEVNRLNTEIEQQRGIVRDERAKAQEDLNTAKRILDNLQANVDSLLDQIRAKERELERVRSTEGYWLYAPWPFKGRSWVNTSAGLFKMTVLGGEISKLYTDYGVATLGLAIPKEAVKVAKLAVNVTPIDIDPRVSPVIAMRDTAILALQSAKLFLEGIKSGVNAFASIGDYIAKYTIGNLLVIHSAEFSANLNVATNGQVDVTLDLSFAGNRQTETIRINFNDPAASVAALGKSLLVAS